MLETLRRFIFGPPTITVRVIVEPDEPLGFHAFTPSLPGIHADGLTEDDALRNITPLIAMYLESLAAHGEPPPVGHQAMDEASAPPSPVAHARTLTLKWPTLRTSGAR